MTTENIYEFLSPLVPKARPTEEVSGDIKIGGVYKLPPDLYQHSEKGCPCTDWMVGNVDEVIVKKERSNKIGADLLVTVARGEIPAQYDSVKKEQGGLLVNTGCLNTIEDGEIRIGAVHEIADENAGSEHNYPHKPGECACADWMVENVEQVRVKGKYMDNEEAYLAEVVEGGVPGEREYITEEQGGLVFGSNCLVPIS